MERENFYEDITEAILRRRPESMEVTFKAVSSDSGTGIHGCEITVKGFPAKKAFCLDELEKAYRDGTAAEDIADSLFKAAMPKILTNECDYEQVKPHLGLNLIGIKKNRELLTYVPHRTIEDLALIPVMYYDTSEGYMRTTVKDFHLAIWGVTGEDVIEEAAKNAPAVMPPLFQPLGSGILGRTHNGSNAHVVSNAMFCEGASALFYKGGIGTVSASLGNDFIVLPASVDYLLVIPTDDLHSAFMAQLYKTYVRDANRFLGKEKVLSESVYRCRDGKIKKIA